MLQMLRWEVHGSCPPVKSHGHKNISSTELQIIIIAEIKYSMESTSILIEGWEFQVVAFLTSLNYTGLLKPMLKSLDIFFFLPLC